MATEFNIVEADIAAIRDALERGIVTSVELVAAYLNRIAFYEAASWGPAESDQMLARDGRAWTTVKDYAEWHDVARTVAGHVIDRYGADALDFVWSVFNEPDLGALFWRVNDMAVQIAILTHAAHP